jgi:hypothetical protein
VHPNDSKKCIYCGSLSIGPGCSFNPNGNIHVHGIDYNSMIRDSIQHSTIIGYIIEKINTPIVKPGSTLERFVQNLQQLLGPKTCLVKGPLINEKHETVDKNEFIRQYTLELEIKKNINDKLNELKEIAESGHRSGISLEKIERIILNNFS